MTIGLIEDNELGGSVRTKLNSALDFVNSQDNVVYARVLGDLPVAVGGVITLLANTTYFIFGDIDLAGSRLVCGANTCILGTSSETSSLRSTGLTGNPLIFTEFTLPMRHVSIVDAEIGCDINSTGVGTGVAIDWYGVNFNGCTISVKCGDVDNFVFNVGAILNGGKILFEGVIGSVVVNSSIFVGTGAAGEKLIEIAPTAEFTRRFRATYSAFVAFGSTTAIDFSVSATVLNEGYILDTCNFSGGSTYLVGVLPADNKTLFVNNVGIDNSSDIAQYYMNGNTTATVVTTAGVAIKAAGVTTSSPITSKFNNTDNRSTYVGALSRAFKVSATLSVESGNNNQIGVYIAKNGVLLGESEVYGTASGSGRAENIVIQTLVSLSATDYIEIWVENATGTQDIVVTELNVIVE